ncbi:uncharacterized protein LOC124943715 [Impatiens glandulifera]|uniref:uncharacterized protein LOC124943715 n=1 Tax=Impatiens glandulifera TaxID=253017 RepID=UPI001FB0CF67|nr:uncharacterized protein LOC124943715 [Impatiens glandulifera]
MATSTREARRRRIVDRSSDRLAFITGQIKTLPSSSSTEPIHSQNAFSPPSISNQFDISTDSPADDNESSSFMKNHDKIDMTSGGTEKQAVLPESETSVETRSLNRFFSPSKINSAVAASETVRLLCSIVIAILPILSSFGFPILSIIVFRPLYLLLLTNFTIVLARLLLENDRVRSTTRNVEYDLVGLIGKTLELGLVFQNVMGAILIDCSVYATLVVCGISVARAMGM